MDHSEFVKKTEMYVRELYKAHQNPAFVYHNLEHIENMVKAAAKIAAHYRLDDEDYLSVLVSAWFHDTGYFFVIKDHEEKSAELAISFLEQEKADPGLIGKVRECIMATKIFCSPPSLIAKIVADADLFHLGTSDFHDNNLRMREEMELRYETKIPDAKWQKGALELLEKHHFHTDYCRNLLQEGKQKNIKYLRERLEK